MRKLMTILAVLALAGAASAQKKKAAAKPAAKIDTAKANAEAKAKSAQDTAKAKADAAQADLAAKAAAATAVDESKFTIAAWGGYSINGRTDFVKAVDTWGDGLSTVGGFTGKATDENTKGVAAGLDFWYGDKFQLGAGASYRTGFKTTKTISFQGAQSGTVANTTQLNYLPVLVQARYFVFAGLYAGAGAGIAVIQNGKTDGGISGNLVNANYPYSTTYSGNVLWFEGRLGYRLDITSALGIEIFGIAAYQTGTIQFQNVDNSGNPLPATEVKNDGLNITPALALSYKF